MNKPFDFKDLIAKLEAQGLPLLEKDVKLLTSCVLDWTGESCVLQGGLVAMIAAGIPFVKEQILKIEDKIDGIDGN